MTDQRVSPQNTRQLLLGVQPQNEVVLSVQKKRQSLSIPLIVGTAIATVYVLTIWVVPRMFTNQNRAQVEMTENTAEVEPKKPSTIPVRLRIDDLGVDTVIEPVGLTTEGNMDVPTEISRAGWLNIGPRPGERGSAVITGHLDQEDGTFGIFQKLYLLKVGDEISITDESEASKTFVVVESRMYNWDDDAPEVFYRKDGIYLNLITCGGAWNSSQEKFEQRLVVFTTLKQ